MGERKRKNVRTWTRGRKDEMEGRVKGSDEGGKGENFASGTPI